MKNNFLIFTGLILLFSQAYGDGSRNQFEVNKGKKSDLLHEGTTLTLQEEESVQHLNPPSHFHISFLGGAFQPQYLSVQSHGHTVNYNFDHLLPLASVNFIHFPWRKNGQWGWAASLSYSYSQYQDSTSTTALHMVPIGLSAVYRGEIKNTQKVIPYIMVGPTLWTYFQRGLDQYNASQSSLIGTATAGLSFNLNRMGLLSSRNDSEVVIQYQRNVDPKTGNSDFSGNAFEIGSTIAL